MSKFWFITLVLLIVGLVYTGVLEVKLNTGQVSNISSLSSVTNNLVKEKTTFEKGRSYVVGLKRKGEFLVVRDKEKRLVLSNLYVKTDARRLEDLIAAKTTPAGLLPQAELLISSLDLVRNTAQKASVEVVAGMKSESSSAFSAAQLALGKLQNENQEYGRIQSEFTRLTNALEEQIGDLGLQRGAVAGASDTNDDASSDTSKNQKK